MQSAETEEDTKAQVEQLYREKNATVHKNGTRKFAAPVKYIDEVKLLSSFPKLRPLSAIDLLQHQGTVLPAHPG